MIQNINGIKPNTPTVAVPEKKPNKNVEKEKESLKDEPAVVFEKSTPEPTTLYDAKKIESLKAHVDAKLSQLKDTVKQLIEKQGLKFEDVLKAIDEGKGQEIQIPIDEETRLKAQEEISEDGFWGVNQTADRILEFAKTISGGDKSKYDLIKGAIEEGYSEAKKAFGDTLPEISEKTLERVLKGLEEWKNE